MATKPKRDYSKYLPLFQVYDDLNKKANDNRPYLFMHALIELVEINSTKTAPSKASTYAKSANTPVGAVVAPTHTTKFNVELGTFNNVILEVMNYIGHKYNYTNLKDYSGMQDGGNNNTKGTLSNLYDVLTSIGNQANMAQYKKKITNFTPAEKTNHENLVKELRKNVIFQLETYIAQLVSYIQEKTPPLLKTLAMDSTNQLNFFGLLFYDKTGTMKSTSLDFGEFKLDKSKAPTTTLYSYPRLVEYYTFVIPSISESGTSIYGNVYKALQYTDFKSFNINLEKWMNRYKNLEYNLPIPIQTVSWDGGLTHSLGRQEDFYFIDEKGRLNILDKTTDTYKLVPWDEFKQNCHGSYVNDDDFRCSDYIINCLRNNSGDSIQKCKEYLQDKSFYENATREVEKINMNMVYLTLTTLQFQTVQENGFHKYVNFDTWVEHLKELNKEEQDAIKQNDKLKDYLDALVSKANRYATITALTTLNPGADSKKYADDLKKKFTESKSTTPPTQKPFTKRVFVVMSGGGNTNTIQTLYNSILDFQNLLEDTTYTNDRFKLLVPQQGGASYSNISDILNFVVKQQNDGNMRMHPRSQYKLSTHLNKILGNIVNLLKDKGLTFNEGDKQAFEKKIMELTDLENLLTDRFITIGKVSYGLLNDDPKTAELKKKGVISYNDMKQVYGLLDDTQNLQNKINKKTGRIHKAIVYLTSQLIPSGMAPVFIP
jgi:hypothetical protein